METTGVIGGYFHCVLGGIRVGQTADIKRELNRTDHPNVRAHAKIDMKVYTRGDFGWVQSLRPPMPFLMHKVTKTNKYFKRFSILIHRLGQESSNNTLLMNSSLLDVKADLMLSAAGRLKLSPDVRNIESLFLSIDFISKMLHRLTILPKLFHKWPKYIWVLRNSGEAMDVIVKYALNGNVCVRVCEIDWCIN